MKLYVPKNSAALIWILNTTGLEGLTLNFTDSLKIFEGYDTQLAKDIPFGKATAYKIDDWNDVSIACDAATKRMIVKVNNVKLYDKINSYQTGLGFINIQAGALSSLVLPQQGWSFYIDDIVLRSIPTLVSTASITPVPIVTISPNPTTGFFTIQWQNADNTPPQYVKVTDIMGRLVYEKKGFDMGTTMETIDLQTVPNGVYFIDYQTVNNRKVEKILIQH
jgi:Secretion system C-terminal sorting domain